MDEEAYLKMFACCVVVKGHTRSTICDLQRGKYVLIPNGMADIIEMAETIPIMQIRSELDASDRETLEEYINYLIDGEFAFWVAIEHLENFPKLELDWQQPQIITNAIIDHDKNSHHQYVEIISQLNELGCQAVELRYYCEMTVLEIEIILNHFEKSRIRTINLIYRDNGNQDVEVLSTFFVRFPRLATIVIHGSSEDTMVKVPNAKGKILFVTKLIDSHSHCGNIDPGYFTVNPEFFLEAQKQNTCLNKKIAIDQYGIIKNCPSSPAGYGHHSTTQLCDVVANENFKSLWNINKDKITICQDCEFRYVCSDCRIFITNPNDAYSKPSKCKYDPYSTTWVA